VILIRGLRDNYNDVVRKKVIPVYVSMATISGIYLATQGRHERAIEKFMQALAIDPTFEPAKKLMFESQTALQK